MQMNQTKQTHPIIIFNYEIITDNELSPIIDEDDSGDKNESPLIADE